MLPATLCSVAHTDFLNEENPYSLLSGTVDIEGHKIFKTYDVFIYLWKHKLHY